MIPGWSPSKCGGCGATIPMEAVDVARHFARCPACGAAHDVVSEPTRAGPRATLRRFGASEAPRGCVAPAEGAVVAERRWRSTSLVAGSGRDEAAVVGLMVVVALAGSAVLVFGAEPKLRALGFSPWARWAVVAVAQVALAWGVSAMLWNRTRFAVGAGRLTVRHGPLPWAGSRDLAIGDIRRITVVKRESQGKRGRRYVRWEIHAVLDAGSVRLDDTDSREIALFLAEALRARVGIGDPEP